MSTAVAPAACFGQGESEPYHRALLTGTGTLTLRPEREHEPAGPVESDVRTWCGDASATERSLLQSLRGRFWTSGAGPDGSWLQPGRSAWPPWASTPAPKQSVWPGPPCSRPRTVNFRPGTADGP